MSKIRKAIYAIYLEKRKFGITQTVLAQRLGCSQSFVSEMLKGDKHMNDETIEKLCDALEISLCDLEKPRKQADEPKEVKLSCDRLKQLHAVNLRGFRSVSRLIDDWLQSSKEKSNKEDDPLDRKIVGS